MGGMIGNLIASGGRLRDNPSLKGDHGQSKCQALQLIRVFGTDSPYGVFIGTILALSCLSLQWLAASLRLMVQMLV
jgi:hypothetical protein